MHPSRLVELVDRRKSRVEQNLPNSSDKINEKINDEYYCKKYFEFLGELLLAQDFRSLYQESNVKLYLVLAARVCGSALLSRLFERITALYDRPLAFCIELILEDIKELSACEFSIVNDSDDYLLFLSRFLISVKTRESSRRGMEVEGPGKASHCLLQKVERLFASDSPGFMHCTEVLQSSFVSFMQEVMAGFLQPERDSLRQSFEKYLLEAEAISPGFGMVLLRLTMLLDAPREMAVEKVSYICKKISCHGLAQLEIERQALQGNQWALAPLDSMAKQMSECDLLGLRLNCTADPRLRLLMLNLQQREYVRAAALLPRAGRQEDSFGGAVERAYFEDCYKMVLQNLGAWEESVKVGRELQDTRARFEEFTLGDEPGELEGEEPGQVDLNSYYLRLLDRFRAGEGFSACKEKLSWAAYLGICEWHSLPRVAKLEHCKLQLQMQCLHELEDWWKSRENGPNTEDYVALSEWLVKYSRSYNETMKNARYHLPHKHEDILTWRVLLAQRRQFFGMAVDRFRELLRSVPEVDRGSLASMTDLHFNQLMLVRQERRFGVYSHGERIADMRRGSLSRAETFMLHKELALYQFNFLGNPDLAFSELEAALKDFERSKEDEQLHHETLLLRAGLYQRTCNFEAALRDYNEVAKSESPGAAEMLARAYFVFCYRAFKLDASLEQQLVLF